MIPAADRLALDEAGYIVPEDFVGASLLRDLRSRVDERFDLEGERSGSEFKQKPGTRHISER